MSLEIMKSGKIISVRQSNERSNTALHFVCFNLSNFNCFLKVFHIAILWFIVNIQFCRDNDLFSLMQQRWKGIYFYNGYNTLL